MSLYGHVKNYSEPYLEFDYDHMHTLWQATRRAENTHSSGTPWAKNLLYTGYSL